MGEKLGVSGTTISRFVRRLGCGNYKEFRRLMADQNIPEGPAVKLMQTLHSEEAFTVDKWFLRQQTYLLKTLEGLEQEEFQKAVSIYSCEKRIVLIGTASDAPPAALVDALVVTVFEQMREASVENLSHLYHMKKICTKLVNF